MEKTGRTVVKTGAEEKTIRFWLEGKEMKLTLGAYLSDNPQRSEEDFDKLGEVFGVLGVRQRGRKRQTEEPGPDPEAVEEGIRGLEGRSGEIAVGGETFAVERLYRLLTGGELTWRQRRRLYLHVVAGLSQRRIARLEGVNFATVNDSIRGALQKLRKE